MMIYLWVALAGGIGAALRFYVTRTASQLELVGFPYATLSVNVLGSFFIGFFAFSLQQKWGVSDDINLILMTGFLGGFTTFSAFSLETLMLAQQGQLDKAVAYALGTVVVCLVACFFGVFFAKELV